MAEPKNKLTFHKYLSTQVTLPWKGFSLQGDNLLFHGIPLAETAGKYDTPFRLTWLPKIGKQVNYGKNIFQRVMEQAGYSGRYHYCYCTKCNHYSHVLREVLAHGAGLETSSPADIDLVLRLHKENLFGQDHPLVHNGYKGKEYLEKIWKLHRAGFTRSITVLDSGSELERLEATAPVGPVPLGIRMSASEGSRFGIPPGEILPLYRERIRHNSRFRLQMLHFFVDSGISDTAGYWKIFDRALGLYVALRKEAPDLNALNIGGGFPIPWRLGETFDYEDMADKIVQRIKKACQRENVPEPDLYTEFGRFTVGESGAVILKVVDVKPQDGETWYIIDSSLVNTVPDAWILKQPFILLPLNHWDRPVQPVRLGGISCDHTDFYEPGGSLLLPVTEPDDADPLYIGFFHTGAYQDAISGYGGAKHCLVPPLPQVLAEPGPGGKPVFHLFDNLPDTEGTLDLLGYSPA